jgi:undecaprenyl-diphosphatase
LASPLTTVVVLALIQGLCEFLPVSSSGHLVLAQALMGLREPEIFLDLILHVGTLLAVVHFYRWTILAVAAELPGALRALPRPSELAKSFRTRPHFRLGALVAIASVPTAALGLGFQDQLAALFGSVRAVGLALMATAAVLIATTRFRPGRRTILGMRASDALIIGLVQGLAICPGLSRSGLTIGAALMLGLDRELAARFSFVLSIPAILGALVLSLGQGLGSSFSPPVLLAGLAVAAASGYLALALLTRLINRGRFAVFAPWCLAAGLWAFFWGFRL